MTNFNNDMNLVHYCPSCGTIMKAKELICPKCGKCCMLIELGIDNEPQKKNNEAKDHKNVYTQTAANLDAQQIEKNLQWTKYRTKAAHGFAAEDANAYNERLKGKKVEQVGRSNEKNGADRITDGQYIQTKYYQTAKGSVNAAFESSTGTYKYIDNNGKPQVLEVPKDQYDECVKELAERIKRGDMKNVGIDNPAEAKNIIKKGDYTYKQAKNIAKAGNIDSLLFDLKTGAVIAVSTFGISFTIDLGISLIFHKKNNLSLSEAIQYSLLVGLKSGCISITSHVAYMQFLKTPVGRKFAAVATKETKGVVNKIWETNSGKKALTRLAKSIVKKDVSEDAAKNVVTKELRTNAITSLITFCATSVPDTVSVIKGNVSKSQYVKNMCIGGAAATGTVVGGWLGGIATSESGGWGAPIGSLVGGFVFEQGAKFVGDQLCEDDALKMLRLVLLAKVLLSNDYLIQSQEEFEYADANLNYYKVIDPTFLVGMYIAGEKENDDFKRVEYAYKRMEYYFEKTIRKRKTIKISHSDVELEFKDIMEQLKKMDNDLET